MENIHVHDPLSTGSKGLIFIGDKVLVYRRDTKTTLFPEQLDLPGGGTEGEETIFETFQREVKEEFGLDILAQDIIYSRSYPSALTEGKTGHFLVAKLSADKADTIMFGDEGTEYFLMTPKKYLARTDAWTAMQVRTADYLHQLK